jgi:hypothetical protein
MCVRKADHFPLIITTSQSVSHPSEVSKPMTTMMRAIHPSKPRKLPPLRVLTHNPHPHPHTLCHSLPFHVAPLKQGCIPSVHALITQPAPSQAPQSPAATTMQESKSKATWRWLFSANHSVPTTPFIIPFPSLGCCCCVAGRQSVRPSLSAVHRRRAGCCVSGGCYTVPPQSPSHSLHRSLPLGELGNGRWAAVTVSAACLPTTCCTSIPRCHPHHHHGEKKPSVPVLLVID